jgi:hypothetical protein
LSALYEDRVSEVGDIDVGMENGEGRNNTDQNTNSEDSSSRRQEHQAAADVDFIEREWDAVFYDRK